MLFNPEGRGLGKVIRAREEAVLRVLWEGDAATGHIVEATGLRREDVLHILGEFHEQGVVQGMDDYTMGQLRVVWSAVFTESEFRRWVSRRIIRSLLDEWSTEAVDEFVEELKTRPDALIRVKAEICGVKV